MSCRSFLASVWKPSCQKTTNLDFSRYLLTWGGEPPRVLGVTRESSPVSVPLGTSSHSIPCWVYRLLWSSHIPTGGFYIRVSAHTEKRICCASLRDADGRDKTLEFDALGNETGLHRHPSSLLKPTMVFEKSRNQFRSVEDMLCLPCYRNLNMISFAGVSPSALFYSNTVAGATSSDINSTNLSSRTPAIFFFSLWCFECISGFELSSLIQGKWGTRSASSAHQASVLFIVGRSNIMEHSMQQGDT